MRIRLLGPSLTVFFVKPFTLSLPPLLCAMRAAFSLSRHLRSRLSLLGHSPPPLLSSLSHLHTIPSQPSCPSLPSKILQIPNPTQTTESPSETLIENEPMNDFLSRFVHFLRPKLAEAFPDHARHVLDEMLLLICQKVIHKLDGSGALSDDPDVELSEDLWKTILEICNSVNATIKRDAMREELKKYIHCDEVKEMCRFATDIGVRGPLLRELRFKWAREKHEEVQFYANLEKMHEEGTKKKRGEEEKPVERLNLTALPERKSRVKYKIYGLDLSDPKWADVAERLGMAEKKFVPEEPKLVEVRCRWLEERLMDLNPKADPAPLLTEWKELMEGPKRVDWEGLLGRIKEKDLVDLYLKVSELLLNEETFKPTIRDYSRLIDYYSKEDRSKKVERILSKMTEVGLEPDAVIHIALVHMYSNLGNLEATRKHFKSLEDAGIYIDYDLYTSMVFACINAGQPKEGLTLLKEMEAKAKADQGIMPDEEIYEGLVKSFAKKGDVTNGQIVMNMMQFSKIDPTLECYIALIKAYGKLGFPEEARNLFDEMAKSGYKSDDIYYDICTASMVHAYMKKNSLDLALDFLLTLEKKGFKPGIYTNIALVDWMGRLQLVDEAEHFAGLAREMGNSLKLHVILCDMYARVKSKRKMSESLKVLKKYKKDLQSDELERIAEGLVLGGFINNAERVVDWMKELKMEPSDSIQVAIKASKSMNWPRKPTGRGL